MGRRSDHSREELLEWTVAAARDVVEAKGPSALTARMVAGRIGYSPGTLYNLFSNFDELVLRVNAVTLDAMQQHMTALKLGGEPVKDLMKLADGYTDFVNANLNLWSLVMDHQSTSEDALPNWFQEKVDRLLGIIEQALAPLFGGRRTTKCREATRVLWSSFYGIWSLAKGGKLGVITDRSVKDMTRSLVVNYVTGLRTASKKIG